MTQAEESHTRDRQQRQHDLFYSNLSLPFPPTKVLPSFIMFSISYTCSHLHKPSPFYSISTLSCYTHTHPHTQFPFRLAFHHLSPYMRSQAWSRLTYVLQNTSSERWHPLTKQITETHMPPHLYIDDRVTWLPSDWVTGQLPYAAGTVPVKRNHRRYLLTQSC